MDLQIKVAKLHPHGSPLGEDEIKLVRKKLKWNYKPFEIPDKLLREWRKIGAIASKKAKIQESRYKNNYLKFKNLNSFKNIIERFKK